MSHASAIKRCRHDKDFEIVTQGCLHIQRQRQSKIRIETAFMELIKQDCGDTLEVWIVQDHARKDALGDDEDPGFP